MSTEARPTQQRPGVRNYSARTALLIAAMGCVALPVIVALTTLPAGEPSAVDMQRMLLWRVFSQGFATATLVLLTLHAFLMRRFVWGGVWVVLLIVQTGLAIWAVDSALAL